MQLESYRKEFLLKDGVSQCERIFGDLMLEHWDSIASKLGTKDPISESDMVMHWREIKAENGKQVLVVAGLLPAIDKEGNEIKDIKATPSVVCIPKELLGDNDWEQLDKQGRKEIIEKIIKDPEIVKYYNFHGWGANPYPFVMPMSDMASELEGVAILGGVMGAMGTTGSESSPHKFVQTTEYGWPDIAKQVMGMMYHLEGEEALRQKITQDRIQRVVVGHSMQGKTVFRLLLDQLVYLPKTYFMILAPLLAGGDKAALAVAQTQQYLRDIKPHVLLGHDGLGKVMNLELNTIGRLGREIRAEILSWAVPILAVRWITEHYIKSENPYGETLMTMAHVLEYVENIEAILLEQKMLENSGLAVSDNTVRTLPSLYKKFMLVYMGLDKVLRNDVWIRLAKASSEVGRAVSNQGEDCTTEKINLQLLPSSNHYPKKEAWQYLIRVLGPAIGVK